MGGWGRRSCQSDLRPHALGVDTSNSGPDSAARRMSGAGRVVRHVRGADELAELLVKHGWVRIATTQHHHHPSPSWSQWAAPPRPGTPLRLRTAGRPGAAGREHPASLADVPRLLSDEAFRAPKVAAVAGDTVGLGGFWRFYDGLGTAAQSQVAGPLMNKLRAFLLRDFARQVVGRGRSSIDMGTVLDGGICLVRVPKGLLGDDTARLLGSFIVAAVWQAATHRARLGQAARVDCSLYIDECQNFLNLPRSFEELLAEAHGYRLSLVLAHQHLAQLPRELRDAVSSNARTKVWFSMTPEDDAHTLGRHVAPEVTEHDLAHLGAYQAAARLVVDGQETPACTLRTRPAPPATPGRAEAVRAAARATFGRPIESATDGVTVDTAPEAMAPEAMAPGAAASSTGWRR